MRLSKCERNKHLLRWSLEKSLLELLPLLLRRFLMFAEACQSFQHPGLQERAALMFLIGCTRKTTGLAFSLRLRFGFCYRVLCYLRLKVLSSDSVGESCVMRGKGTCKLSLWWYYIIIYMYAMYMQCITLWLIDYVEVMYAEYSCSVNNVQFAIKDSFHKRTYSITCDQKLAARSQRHTAARTISKEHLGVKRHRPLWRTASDLFKGVSIICRVCRLVMCDGFMKSRSTYPGKHQT